MIYDETGALRVTWSDGQGYKGLYAPDGSTNVTETFGSSYVGSYAPDGSLNVQAAPTGTVGLYAPSGALYVNTTSHLSGGLFVRPQVPTPVLSLSFLSGTLDPLVTFARTTTGTNLNSSGLLTTTAINTARFDYDPVTLLPRGLLMEAAATNIVKHSRDLTNVLWVKTNTSALKDQTGIDGVANSASSLTASADNGTCLQTNTLASSSRLQSAYVKRLVGSGPVQMTTDGGTTWTTLDVTAGWTRVTIAPQTVTNPSLGFKFGTSGDSIAVDYVQNETSTGTQASSPIATTTASVTRAIDTALVSGVNFTNFYNTVQGTFVTEASSFGTGTRGVMTTNDGTTNNRMDIRANGSALGISGNVGQFSFATVAFGSNTIHKVALAYQVNNFAVASDGGSLLTDTAGAVPVGSTTLRLGELSTGGSGLNGHLRSLVYYNKRLPNVDLLALTAPS